MAPLQTLFTWGLVAVAALVDARSTSPRSDLRTRRWANYKRATGDGAALPQISPISGATITKSVQQQIKSDVNAVLAEFTGLPADVQNVLKTAIGQIMNQKMYTEDPETQLQTVASAINAQLLKTQQSLPVILGQIPALTDQANFQALQNCINYIVSIGGQKDAQDGSCLSQSGFSIDSITQQFNAFVDMNQFVIPATKANSAAQQITDYLNSVTLVPSVEYLIGNASASIQNVIDATAAKDRDATEAAFKCWITAITTISQVSLQDRQLTCDTQINDVQTQGQSTLQALEERYIDITNQYAGVLPPNLAFNIQQIGIATMTMKLGSYDSNVRDYINSAILSATSQTAGQTASLSYDLINCLNTLYEANTAQCNPLTNPDILSRTNLITFNYLDQFVSILPTVLVNNMKSAIEAQISGNTSPDADALRAQLDALVQQAALGPAYDSCEQVLINCVTNAVVNGVATTDCYNNKGAACDALPPLAPSQIDSSDPYSAIINGLQGNGTFGQRQKRAKKTKRLLETAIREHQQRRSPNLPRTPLF